MQKKEGDIYSGASSGHEPGPPSAGRDRELPQQWRKDYLKSRFWSFFLGLVVFAFIVAVVWLLIDNYLQNRMQSADYRASQLRTPQNKVPRYGLSLGTDWVLDYESDLNLFEEIGTNCPFDVHWLKRAAYHVIMGEQAFQMQKTAAAEEHFSKAQKIFPELRGLNQPLGNIYLQQRDYDRAVTAFERAAESGQLTYRLANNIGAACMGAGQYEKAEFYLKKALDLRKDYAESYKNLALLYRRMKQPEESITYFERYLQLNPGDLDTTQVYALYLTSEGRWKKAAAILRGLNEKLPEVAPLYFLRAQVEIQLGNHNVAVDALKRGIQLVDSSYALGWMSKDDFDVIRDSTEFQKLLSQMDMNDLSMQED
ncbi:tetratricopeptide repeat protein [Kiritimatiella glycovorans]|uniref:Tetratricopeptide repeat protein n=1 Tax=Kiritimatiella glycovorans TaxID=1307763 RepID=A0A0G3EJ95_9BACT|nr:tetratricopeptide repeat protein [Kiritimatiella glycovorans]AKJ64254.1 tetratricopeptide repeat protein [Kiritimatiella glycovorans]